MVIPRNPEPGRQAVLWLATALVLLLGAAVCAFIILAAVENPSRHFILWGAIFGGLVMLMFWGALPRNKNSAMGRLRLWFAARNRSDPRNVLRIGRKAKPTKVEFGGNAPPSVESVRDAAELNVSWVPHGPPPNRPRPGT